jgi:hypothetical protein
MYWNYAGLLQAIQKAQVVAFAFCAELLSADKGREMQTNSIALWRAKDFDGSLLRIIMTTRLGLSCTTSVGWRNLEHRGPTPPTVHL